MNTSLRDQLLAAGLITEDKIRQASQADEQRRRQQKNRGKSAPKVAPPAPTQQAQAKKKAYDQELNRRQQEKMQRRALRAQIEQLVEQARLPRLESDDYYSFVDAGKIRRLAVDLQRREKIIGGELAVVRYKHYHEVVPAQTAERIHELDQHAVVTRATQQHSAAADDPYKDFVVPDDLTW